MKILCISKYSSPPKYGVGSRLYYLSKEFANKGNDVTLISSDSNHLAKYPDTKVIFNEEQIGNLKHIWIKTYKYAVSSSFKRLISWIDFDRKLFKFIIKKNDIPEVVIISSLSLTSILYGIHLKRKYKCKLVFEVRDIYPLTMIEELGFKKYHPLIFLFTILEKRGYKKADLIVGTMPNLSEHVCKVLKNEKEVFFSSLGIPEIWNHKMAESNDIDKMFPKEKIIVGYAGSMSKSNALFPLMDAIRELSETNSKIHFVLVGDGETREKLEITVRNCYNVTFGGKIEQKYIPYFLSKCDMLYLATHKSKVWQFGQSMNKMIDYMLAAKPIIASYSGYQSMLNESKSGVFIPVGSSVDIINSINYYSLLDKTERQLIGNAGRDWIKANLSYEKLAINYLNKLKKVVSN